MKEMGLWLPSLVVPLGSSKSKCYDIGCRVLFFGPIIPCLVSCWCPSVSGVVVVVGGGGGGGGASAGVGVRCWC